MNDTQFQDFVGRQLTMSWTFTAEMLRKFAATIDMELSELDPDAPLGCQWVGAGEETPTGHLAEDGHAPKGAFLPPIELPARMSAGGVTLSIRSFRTECSIVHSWHKAAIGHHPLLPPPRPRRLERAPPHAATFRLGLAQVIGIGAAAIAGIVKRPAMADQPGPDVLTAGLADDADGCGPARRRCVRAARNPSKALAASAPQRQGWPWISIVCRL